MSAQLNGVFTPVVLLVDDQPMVAEGIRRMLADQADIRFYYCDKSSRALEKAIKLKPTVILQDLIMPELEGYELLQRYRQHRETRNIPVIVLSTKEEPRDKSLAFEHGANDYLVKLPDKIELIARIRAHSRNYLVQCERDDAFDALGRLQRQLEINNEELQKLTCQDALTGIANRRRFNEFFTKECLRSAREKTPLSLLLIDIDYFKLYNDNHGHLRGDDAIREVAEALHRAVQRPADLVARYGGEEFAVILPNTDVEGALKLAHNLQNAVVKLRIPHVYSDVSDFMTVSIGLASKIINETNSPEELIELADRALYEAKHSGRNCCKVSKACYTPRVVSHSRS